ncbi:hypothetical protein [Winogradskyella alexanderae]|uniref:Lipoprotein n=1 Tax=Winogradskyella alexanderae TaxID=2877123 RepID=A0ABS7XXK9_9FLAO|nr:hypothetical protein [Winogradskyella alexanderae]MCA0133556.1 hypothetical protein [Winogradskyella alexanderae]
MKIKFLYIMALLMLSISCNEKSVQLNDIFLECYDSKYQKEGVEIKTIINDYEKLLVKDGILKDNSGKSYLEVYQKIASNKNFRIQSRRFMEFDPLFKVDNETKMAIFKCEVDMTELAQQQDSKWHKVFGKTKSQEIKENPELMYQTMVESLSKDDLNSYYFKLKMFNLFDMVNVQAFVE